MSAVAATDAAQYNEKGRGYGPMAPAEGYGPRSDDPVSYQRYFTKIANPGPAGILSFSMTTFLWALYSVSTRGVHTPNAIIGLALFLGGLVMFLAGMWEFPRGNVWGATGSLLDLLRILDVLLSRPASRGRIQNSFSDSHEFGQAYGLYLIVWFMISVIFLISVVRRSISFAVLLFFWSLTYLMLAIGQFRPAHARGLNDAGGAFSFVTAVVGFYIGLSQLMNAEMATLFPMPLGHVGPRVRGPAPVGAGAAAV
ncbi:GPR1/FUN34/yaaH family-domain-containing protein [Cyathus striatus]|nr:GPR1/FUN34/yaaH family-domain-containing protein [Cyathus striatus]